MVYVPFLHNIPELFAKVVALFDEFSQFVVSRMAL